MFILWKVIVASVLLSYFVSSLELKGFETEDEFFKFYEEWMRVTNIEEFERIENALSEMVANKSADPCENFYEYACGGWRNTFPKSMQDPDFSLDKLPHIAGRKLMEGSFQTEIQDDDSEVTRKVKQFYQTCMDQSTWKFSDFGEFIQSLALWPVSTNNWHSSDFDWAETEALLNLYRLKAFLDVVKDFKNGTRCYRLSRNYDVHGTLERAGDLSILNLPRFRFSEKDSADVKKFYKQVDGSPYFAGSEELYTVAELEILFPNIKKFLMLISGEDIIHPNETVILQDGQYFRALSNLLTVTPTKTVANFMFVQAVIQILEITKLAEDPSKFCNRFVFAGNMPGNLEGYMTKYHFDDASAQELLDIFSGVRENLMKSAAGWGESETQINELANFYLNVPMYTTYKERIEVIYSLFDVYRRSFCWTIFFFQGAAAKSQLRGMINEFQVDMGIHESRSQRKLWSRKIYDLSPMTFHKYSYPAENYASIGQQMAESLLYQGVSDTTVDNLSQKLQCYLSELGAIEEPYYVRSIAVSMQSLAVAYKALHERFQDKNLADDRKFFLRFAQTRCGLREDRRANRLGSYGVLDILANSAEFNAAYNCPVGSKMNPSIVC